MATILDRLAVMHWNPEYALYPYLQKLKDAESLVADNVFAYYYEHMFVVVHEDGKPVEVAWETDFPNIAPPWSTYFVSIENIAPLVEIDAKKHRFPRYDPDVLGAGVLIHAQEIMETQPEHFMKALEYSGIASSRLELKRRGVKWVLYCMPIALMRDGRHSEPIMLFTFLVDEKGKNWMIQNQVTDKHGMTWIPVYDNVAAQALARLYKEPADEVLEYHVDFAANMIFPALLATTFMHVRNVEVVTHAPPRKASETRKRKFGRPLVTYRTIQIEPIRRVLRDEGGIVSNGLGVALHLCRGHFKDFSEGKGLFGKHKDIYFWHEQTRGTHEAGVVHADYIAPAAEDTIYDPTQSETT